MTERIKTLFTSDIPNWMVPILSIGIPALAGIIVMAASAWAEQKVSEKYVQKVTYEIDKANHAQVDALKTASVLEQVDQLKKQIETVNAQISYNNRLTERNAAILERLDKR